MKASYFVSAFVATAAAQNACINLVQAILAPLRPLQAVQSFCSSKYPPTTSTSTIVSTVRTTFTPSAVIVSFTYTATPTVYTTITPPGIAITSTYTVTSTTMTTLHPEYTVIVIYSQFVVATVTKTTFINTMLAKRATSTTQRSFGASSTTLSTKTKLSSTSAPAPQTTGENAGDAAISTLLGQAAGVVATFCSCAQSAPRALTTISVTTSVITVSALTIAVSSDVTRLTTSIITAPIPTLTISSTITNFVTVTSIAPTSRVTSTNTITSAYSTVTVTECGDTGQVCAGGCGCYRNVEANNQIQCFRPITYSAVNCGYYYSLRGGQPCGSNGESCIYYAGGLGDNPSLCAETC